MDEMADEEEDDIGDFGEDTDASHAEILKHHELQS
jgi:hypothetical protein